MSLTAREQQALQVIADGLAGSDPDLASLLATFTRLALGEEVPAREEIQPGWRKALRRLRRRRGQPGGGRAWWHARLPWWRLRRQRGYKLIS